MVLCPRNIHRNIHVPGISRKEGTGRGETARIAEKDRKEPGVSASASIHYLMDEELQYFDNTIRRFTVKRFVQIMLIVNMLFATSVAAMAAAAAATTATSKASAPATTTASTCPAPKVLLNGACVACPAGAEYRRVNDTTGKVKQVLCVTKASCPTGTTLDANWGGCKSTTTPCPPDATGVNGTVCTVPATVAPPSCPTGSSVFNGECVSCPDPKTQQLFISGATANCSLRVNGVAATCAEGKLYENQCISCPTGTTLSQQGLCIAQADKRALLTCPAGATLQTSRSGLPLCLACPTGMTVDMTGEGFVRCRKSPDTLSKATCSTGYTLRNGKCVKACPSGSPPVETTAGVFSCQLTATSCPAGTTAAAGNRCSTNATCPQSTTLEDKNKKDCLANAQ